MGEQVDPVGNTVNVRLRARHSDPAELKRSKLHADAAVDVFTIAALVLLLVAKAVPAGWEVTAFLGIIGIGGGSQLLQALGKRGGGGVVMVAVGFVPVLLSALAKSRVVLALLLAFMGGCAALLPIAADALRALAPIAADVIRNEAKRRGEQVDESQAICVPLPEEYQPDDGAIYVVCVAPVRDE